MWWFGAGMALPRAFRTAPCPEVGPHLRAGFPDGWPDSTAVPTGAQLMMITDMAEVTGYQAVMDLDTDWLPSRTVLARGLDRRPNVTELRIRS